MEIKKQIFTQQQSVCFATHLAHRVAMFPEGGKIIILSGEMGVGKTFFTNAFTHFFLGSTASSPSFSLVQIYSNASKTIIHFDFQRIPHEEAKEIFSEYESLYPDAVFIIEWVFEGWEVFFKHQAVIEIIMHHTKSSEYREWQICFHNPFSISISDALTLQDELMTPVHIRRHIAMVQKIAVFCAKKLQENAIPIDIPLVEASALCHDIVKYIDFTSISLDDGDRYDEPLFEEKILFWKHIQKKYESLGHEKAMQQILQEKKWHATGKVVASHRSKAIYEEGKMSWEEKCVYYADKRALHDGLVSLSERLIDGAARYEKQRNLSFEAMVFALEKQIQTIGKWDDTDLEEYCKKSAVLV